MSGTFAKLNERGYIANCSEPRDKVVALLDGQTTIYQGFDPTASSLHVGHLESLMAMHHMQQGGHRMIFLVGGGTAVVGDPTDRAEGRAMLELEQVRRNAEAIREQVQRIGLLRFDNPLPGQQAALMLNNADWLDMPLLTYLRDVTAHFSINELLRRETFARRLREQLHLSLLELLYPTLQGFDFLYLYDHHQCMIQLGGSDQWGNIVDGIDLVGRVRRQQVYGVVFPLLTSADGQKMGKTGTGQTIWLDPARTSPFDFYQYWLRCPDADLERNLKLFTLLPLEEIAGLLQAHPREVQRRLAFEVTRLIHGEAAAAQAQSDAEAAFGQKGGVPQDVLTYKIPFEMLNAGLKLVNALQSGGATSSISDGRRLIQQGAVRLNDTRVSDQGYLLQRKDFLDTEDRPVALVQYGRGKVIKLVLLPEISEEYI